MDGNSQTSPVGETTTDVLNRQAREIAALTERNRVLAEQCMQADAYKRELLDLCGTTDPAALASRADDMNRVNFLIHHATKIEIGSVHIDLDQTLLNLRAVLDAQRVELKDATPLRTP